MEQLDWQNKITEPIKGMLVTHPGMHPGAMRVDQLDREQDDKNVIKYPEIVHFGTRPQQLCYAGNAEYQKVWREYIKFRHLLANMPKPTFKVCIYFLISKVLSFLEVCFDLILSPSLSMKIQIMGGKITENLGFKSLLRKVKNILSLFSFHFQILHTKLGILILTIFDILLKMFVSINI